MDGSGAVLNGAFEAFSRGNLAEAARLCDAALARAPRDARALQLAAAIALRQGRPDVALARAGEAVAYDPGSAHAYQTRGQLLRTLGHGADAERDFRRAIEIDPAFPEARASLGALLVANGRPAEARAHLERALHARPDAAEWRYNLALCDLAEQRLAEAREQLERVLTERPQWPKALNTYGALLVHLGEPQDALGPLAAAVAAAPTLERAWANLGLAQLACGRAAEARGSFERCVAIEPADPEAWTHLGNALRALGDRPGAERAYREALGRDASFAPALQNLGNLLREDGRLEEAIDCLSRASEVSGDPAARLSLAIALLGAGELERGWAEYAWRNGNAPRPLDAARRAMDSGAVVALEDEQGLGDMLFFLRWAEAAPRSARFAWRGDSRLQPLLEGTRIEATNAEEIGASLPLGELPRLIPAAPHPAPFGLHVPAPARDRSLEALRPHGPAPYLAVAWRAGLAFNAAEERLVKEVPFDAFCDALRHWPGTLVSVQRNPRPGEIEALRARSGRPVFDAASFNDDLAKLAALLAAMDLYAGVSSTNVHIAAGVGLAAHILVPRPGEWRYAGTGKTTPWFPGYVLHREAPGGGWEGALAGLSQALAAPRAP